MEDEYDFTGGQRGKYAKRYAQGVTVATRNRPFTMKQVRGKIGGYMSAACKADKEGQPLQADELRFEAAKWKAKLKEFPKKGRK